MNSEEHFEKGFKCEVEVINECRKDRYIELSVKLYRICTVCNDTKEVENPLTGELHFCPICGEN